jgi:uncharacterized protein UPF0547
VNPLVVYVGFIALTIVIGVLSLITVRDPQRACPRCGNSVSLAARVCRFCRYRMSGREL